MRYTPFLDRMGVRITATTEMSHDQIDQLVNVLDSALSCVNSQIDWGEYKGRKRKPCEEQPLLLTGMPIGQYHCQGCGMMLLAGLPHMDPNAREQRCTCPAGSYDPGAVHEESCELNYPLGHYEDEYGQPWPPGYEGETAEKGADDG